MKRIVIIEDDARIRSELEILLHGNGYQAAGGLVRITDNDSGYHIYGCFGIFLSDNFSTNHSVCWIWVS